jgi:predicted MFS family arabinose efflux permease
MPIAPFSPKRERWLLIILAGIQFAHIMDFMVLAPLGPQFMRLFGISAQEFSLLVSSYMFTAAIVGLIAAFYIDRFDRRIALLWMYSGFSIATLLCALAPNFHALLITRAITGAFGGVLGAIVLSIVSDAIPEARRGAAMGLVMSELASGVYSGDGGQRRDFARRVARGSPHEYLFAKFSTAEFVESSQADFRQQRSSARVFSGCRDPIR